MDFPAIPAETEAMARSAVDAGMKVHAAMGPGLLESAYEHCLARELRNRGISVLRQVVLPIEYAGAKLDAGYRIDLWLGWTVIVEIKSIDCLAAIHQAQLLTYLRLSNCRLGFKDGIKRLVL